METKGMKITTADQFTLLLQEIEKHPELLKQTPVFDHSRNEEVWVSITNKLNAIGPPERSMREWKRVFINLKANTKKKMAVFKEVGFSQKSLSEVEKGLERILKLNEPVQPVGETFEVPAIKLSPPFTTDSMSPPSFADTTEELPEDQNDQNNFLLQDQVKYMDLSQEMVEIMARQTVLLHKLTDTVDRQERLMEQLFEMLERQILAIERQAAAMERMAELQ